MLRQIHLSSWLMILGGVLTIVGFVAYFQESATLNLVGFFYGIPALLGGLALRASELKPVPFSQTTPPEVLALREQQATPTQNQLRKDVTRYRYGQDVHLDEALKRIGLGRNDDELPILDGIREVEIDGAYTLILEFQSAYIPLDAWKDKRSKIEKFFGPGVLSEVTQPSEERVELKLITSSEPSS